MTRPIFQVTCGTVNIANGPALFGKTFWSQTMSNPGVTDSVAPDLGTKQFFEPNGFLAFEVFASADSFVSIGPSPEDGPSIFLGRDETRHLTAKAGDRVAWKPA